MAALLALLDGRGEVSVEDWQLAGVLWETSCGVRDAVVAIGQSHAEQERAARDDARVTLADRTAASSASRRTARSDSPSGSPATSTRPAA